MATLIFDTNFRSMEANKNISKDKDMLMTAKMGDSISINTLKRGSRGSVYKWEGHNRIKHNCKLVQ